MEFVWLGVAFSVGCIVLLAVLSIRNRQAENDFIESARRVRAGMTMDDVIIIMGSDFTYSALKSGIEKLEWRYRKNGYSYRVGRGVSMRQSGYTRRISVKFKNRVVIEISSLNMD